MTTARSMIELALKQAGILGVGQSALAEDVNDGFTLLNNMINQWRKRRWLNPSLQKLTFTADGSLSYSIGIGGTINMVRPADIKAGYMVQLNTGSNPVSLPLKKIFSYEDYIRITIKNLSSLPDHFFYDAQYPLAHIYPWPVPNSQYQLNFLCINPIIFGTTIATGAIKTGGTLYTDGIYNSVPLTGGLGTGAQADITITGGVVALVNLNAGGVDYAIGDILSVAAANVGGTGSGFTWTVSTITANVDSELLTPEEYEEAIMNNLALRLCAMYQIPANEDTRRLAKSSLNTIRMANTQVPTLTMPAAPGVRTGKAFNLYNADGY